MHISYWVKTIIEIYLAGLVIVLVVVVPGLMLETFLDGITSRPKRSADTDY